MTDSPKDNLFPDDADRPKPGHGEVIKSINPIRGGAMVSIKVGKRTVARMRPETARDLALHVGMRWTDELAGQVDAAATLDAARQAALNSLNRRAQSRRKLNGKLRDKGFASEVRERVLDRLEELGLLDDAVLGRSMIADMDRLNPVGPRRMVGKLIERGLDRNLAESLVNEHVQAKPTGEMIDQLRELAAKKYRTLARHPRQVVRRRLFGQLARRGYDSDMIVRVIDELLADHPDDGDDASQFGR